MLASSGLSEADRSLGGQLDIHREVQASQDYMTRPFLNNNNNKNTNKTTKIQAQSSAQALNSQLDCLSLGLEMVTHHTQFLTCF